MLVYNKSVNIIDKIKRVRISRNISQKEMGHVLSVAKETYRDIETGRVRLKLDDYLKICDYLQVPSFYFLSHDIDDYALIPRENLQKILGLAEQVVAIKNHVISEGSTFEDDLHLYLSDSSDED